jgi:hypothetical protein
LSETQTERFLLLEEGRWVTITAGYYRLLYSTGETDGVADLTPPSTLDIGAHGPPDATTSALNLRRARQLLKLGKNRQIGLGSRHAKILLQA